jgi:hypothetical protein
MGSGCNLAATDFCAWVIASAGFDVKTSGFKCMDWVTQGATLRWWIRVNLSMPL